MDAASMSSKEAGAADSEARRAQDSTQRLEAEVKRLSTSLAELALAYRSATSLCRYARFSRILRAVHSRCASMYL